MKREDITTIFPDATKEQIDKLMGINGEDINKVKAELTSAKDQLTEAQTALTAAKDAEAKLTEATQSAASLRAELDAMKHTESVRQIREKVSTEKKIPANLLKGETEEDCTAEADAILAFANPSGYPSLKDGGNPGGSHKTATRDQFAAWAKENI